MEGQKIHLDRAESFSLFAVLWVIWGWLALIAAVGGFFYGWINTVYFLAASGALLYLIYAKKITIGIDSELAVISVLAAVIILVYSFFVTPTVFSGRDQGSLSEAAVRLSQNHKLKFSTAASLEFYKINSANRENFYKCLAGINPDDGVINSLAASASRFWCEVKASGKSLNFPGFYYTADGNLLTQFPLAYIAWLASFYSIFGLAGLVVGNAMLFFIFLVSFYFLLRYFLPQKFSIAAVILAAASFPFFWFYKFSLSENMALALVWFGIFQLFRFRAQRNSVNYAALISVFSLLILTRIEGFLLFLALIALLFLDADSRKFILSKKIGRILIPAVFLVIILCLVFHANFPFFKEMAKAATSADDSGIAFGWQENILAPGLYLLNVFITYAILPYFIFGAAGIALLAKRKKWMELIPLFIIFPTLAYLLDSHISSDHPWMLRRYVFSIVPAFYFYTFLLLNRWLEQGKKILAVSVLLVFFLLNMPLLAKYLFFSENKDLLKQTAVLSQNFSPRDLVLVDRLATGDGWSMVSGPLSFHYGKQSAYIFNPDDLGKIDLDNFDRIFLVTPDKKIDFYQNSPLGAKLKFYRDYSFSSRRLAASTCPAGLPAIIPANVKGKIFEIEK